MTAVRLQDIVEDPEKRIDSEFRHLSHMYSGRFSDYYYKRLDMALDAANLDSKAEVLELGGGTGIFTLSLLDSVKQIYFVDIDHEGNKFQTPKQLFSMVSAEDDNIEFIAGDGTALPFTDNSLDCIFALDVLEHIPDEETAIAECRRVLSDDGQIIISAPIEVGPILAVREFYRFIDGRRHHSGSLKEVVERIFGRSPYANPYRHRGYDYRDTIAECQEQFDEVSVDFCPVPILQWINPTAIINVKC